MARLVSPSNLTLPVFPAIRAERLLVGTALALALDPSGARGSSGLVKLAYNENKIGPAGTEAISRRMPAPMLDVFGEEIDDDLDESGVSPLF